MCLDKSMYSSKKFQFSNRFASTDLSGLLKMSQHMIYSLMICYTFPSPFTVLTARSIEVKFEFIHSRHETWFVIHEKYSYLIFLVIKSSFFLNDKQTDHIPSVVSDCSRTYIITTSIPKLNVLTCAFLQGDFGGHIYFRYLPSVIVIALFQLYLTPLSTSLV